MWIHSWGPGFLSESQTDQMIKTARENNINCIFPQVRKVADAYYNSSLEPFASNIEEGYEDPLADIIAKAHDTSDGKQYIEVHAWIVPFRVWRDTLGEPPANHVLSKHPEWFTKTIEGVTQEEGSTRLLDPGLPEVLDYLVDVATEIIENYDVDGIHWDYFRYSGPEWGYNQTAIDRFNKLYGKTGIPAQDDPDFSDFRRDQIRQLGRKSYAAVKAIKWDCKMSAATINWGPCPEDFTQCMAYYRTLQDWVGFMDEGLLDMNVLMNYKRETVPDQKADYPDYINKIADTKAGRHAINGPGIFFNHIHDSITQILIGMDTPGIDGTNLYAYNLTNGDGHPASDFWNANKADCFTERRSIPKAPWLEEPYDGILMGTVSGNSSVIDGAVVTFSDGNKIIKTDGTGFYAFLKVDAGIDYTVTVSAPGFSSKSKTADVSAGKVTTLNFELDNK